MRKGLARSFNNMVDFCVNNGVQLMLLSGDIFDSSSHLKDAAELFANGLSRLRNTAVFAALGNHDFNAPLPNAPNLHVFPTKAEDVFIPSLGISVWGQSFPTENPPSMTELFKEKDGINLLCVHANLNGEGYNPILPDQLKNGGFIYAALGHKHSFYQEGFGSCTACYSGCIAGRGFDETGEKGFVYGEIDAANVKTKFIPSGAAKFEALTLRLTDIGRGLTDFENSLCESSLYRVTLIGEGVGAEYVRRRLENKVFYAEVYAENEAAGPFFDLLKNELKDNPRALNLAYGALMGRRDLF